MKKFTKTTLIIVLGIILCMLCACKPGTNTPPDNEKETFTVNFIVGGQTYASVEADENGNIQMPDEPVPGAGYIFDGWFTDEAFSVPFTADTVVSENISVYAKISRKVFTVSFIVNGETYKTDNISGVYTFEHSVSSGTCCLKSKGIAQFPLQCPRSHFSS